MKLKEGFVTYEVSGEHFTVPVGDQSFSGLIKSNKTAAFVIEMLKNDTTAEEITKALYEKYDAPEEMIRSDVDSIINKLREIGAIDE
ncbi:MAG: PqqD family protein [Clostridia bacterium]|nr:PqqD family protein [Clostridia bacterium]